MERILELTHYISLLFLFISPSTNAASEFGTAEEAQSLVQKAIAHIKAVGPDVAYADFTNKKPGWVDRDLYVIVYNTKGIVLAHGQNPQMVGMDMIDFKDADGKEFIKERIKLAKTQNSFWHDYKFTDPATKKILHKSTYCETLNDTIECSGIYKR